MPRQYSRVKGGEFGQDVDGDDEDVLIGDDGAGDRGAPAEGAVKDGGEQHTGGGDEESNTLQRSPHLVPVDRMPFHKKFMGVIVCSVVIIGVVILAMVLDHNSNGAHDSGPADFVGYTPLVVISIDAFKPEYLHRNYTPTLAALARRGVLSEGMIPVYPSKTFPNHYSIATGLYPAHHGIVSNHFCEGSAWDDDCFNIRVDAAVDRWWLGEPIWTTAVLQGLRAGVYYWIGSEAKNHGVRPTYYHAYDKEKPYDSRVDDVLDNWVGAPPAQRPQLIMMYFSAVDTAGHLYGPASQQVDDALVQVDAAIGRLVHGLQERSIEHNMVVVSDHGMAPIAPTRVVYLEDYLDLSVVRFASPRRPEVLVFMDPAEGRFDEVLANLTGAHAHMEAWRREEVPERFHYRESDRISSIVLLASLGWLVSPTREDVEGTMWGGAHGYDNEDKDMNALFLAAGPNVRPSGVIPEFLNLDVYNFLSKVLGVHAAPNDGTMGLCDLIYQPSEGH